MKKCEKCGFTTENNDMNFCGNCGNRMTDINDTTEIYRSEDAQDTGKTPNDAVTYIPNKSNGGIIAACTMAVAFIVVAVLVFALPHNKEDKLVSDEISDTVNVSEITEEFTTTMDITTMTEAAAEEIVETTVETTALTGTTAAETKAAERKIVPDPDEGKLFRQGLMPVSDEEGYWGYINASGEYVIVPQFSSARNFSQNGLAPVCNQYGVWGYIDTSGEYVIRSQYEDAYSFNGDGLAIASKKEETYYDWSGTSDDKMLYGYIDESGEFVIEPKFAYAYDFAENGLALVKEGSTYDDTLYGYIDYSGDYAIPLQFKDAKEFASNGLAAAAVDYEKYGYINREGEFVIEPKYVVANTFNSEGLASVAITDYDNLTFDSGFERLYGCIDENGDQIIDFKYGYLSNFDKNGYAQYCEEFENYSIGIISRNESIIKSSNDCYGATMFNHGLAYVSCIDGGYINERREIVLAIDVYAATCFFDDGFAMVDDGDSIDIIDTNGNVVKKDLHFIFAESNGYIYDYGLHTYFSLNYPDDYYLNGYFAESP